MYKTIYVPVDNSEFSNRAVGSAIELGKRFDSKLVGCHVYAASLHDYRFKQMEYTLPEEYLEETELERQRRIHDSLITMGLQLISDSYLESMRVTCEEEGIEFEPKMMDGKHHVEIVRDLKESDYDLTVLGAMGIGRVRDSQIGSVCERVARSSHKDVWVIKRVPTEEEAARRDTILVGIDGSPQSFGALATAVELAEKFNKKIEVISVYDPYLHYSVFKGVVEVLTERAAKIFRFEEQNQLHEEIIDTGLAQIYQSHLEVAEKIAQSRGVEVKKTLLDGKAFQKILDHVRKNDPWLVVIGRIGVHSSDDETGLGSNAENLLRNCPCDVLLSTRLERPELDLKAEESIRWTEEAEERFKRVPDMVKGIARTAIYRLAVEQGHSVISSDVLDDAMERYMPKYTARETEQLAEKLAIEVARSRPTFLCKTCGVTSFDPDPVRCSVCQGTSFEVITQEMVERIAALEGGLESETTYDGKKLTWTQDAKRALKTLSDLYQRRRAKARIEKKARIQRLPSVTLAFAQAVIEEETGEKLILPVEERSASETVAPAASDERRLVARDVENNPLLSAFSWQSTAVDRLFRVPAGLMRDKTQQRAENLAAERGAAEIDLDIVEAGIEQGRVMMEQMIRSLEEKETPAEPAKTTASSADEVQKENAGSKCPFAALAGNGTADTQELKEAAALYLNEVGMLSAMDAKRRDLANGDND